MRAILSVSDKTGLVEFARGLTGLGVQLISTGGTAKAISAAGLPVRNVSDVTGFPEMMDGRVKTLHPAIFGGILARRHRVDDVEAIGAHGIEPIDIVVVNLYPFGKAAENPDTPFESLVEEIDIGGPSLLRAAGKNFRDVLVVVSPDDYARVLQELAREGGPSLDFRFDLMRKAFMHTGQYDGMIAMTMMHVDVTGDEMERRPAKAPAARHPEPKNLRYGENPHQKASWLPDAGRIQPGVDGSPGQGTVVHEPARSRFRVAHRARIQRACERGDQAYESMRCGHRYVRGRGLRTRPRRRPAVGFRRHRRTESSDRCRDGASAHRDLHRGGHRPLDRRRGESHPRDEAEPARDHDRFHQGVRTADGAGSARDAILSRRDAGAGAGSRDRGDRAVAAESRSLPRAWV